MVLKIGHRGAAGYEPENTLLSIKKALQLKVDFVELDVQVCKTGEVIAMHDSKIDRTTNGKGYITERTFEELRMLDAGKGEKIPTLEEVLDLVDRKTKVNIEIKGENAAKAVFNILKIYVNEKSWTWGDFLISSFNHPELLKLKELIPDVKIGAVIAGIPVDYAACAEKVHAYSLHPSKEFINQTLIDDAHKRGLQVFIYTLNDKDDIDLMKSIGVDGIFSDFPDRL
ncbi:MAG: glycerophosphodiester phosphodiesterase family protein [bacterium]